MLKKKSWWQSCCDNNSYNTECSCVPLRCSTRWSVQLLALWDHCTASAWPRLVWASDPCVGSRMNGYTLFPTIARKYFSSLNKLPSAVFIWWTLQLNSFQFLITRGAIYAISSRWQTAPPVPLEQSRSWLWASSVEEEHAASILVPCLKCAA